jgi:membrane protease YdiL (CAAX protease family)
MALLPPIWSRALILVAIVFGGLSFIVSPEMAPEKRARLEVRGLIGELFLYEGLEGRKTLEQVQEECAQPTNLDSCFLDLKRNTEPILRALRRISGESNLAQDSPERIWLSALSESGYDLGPPSQFVKVKRTLLESVPGWLRVRWESVQHHDRATGSLESVYALRAETWRELWPWAAFFGLILLMSAVGLVAWFLHNRIFKKGPLDPDVAKALEPVDALGYVGLWLLFRLIWSALFPAFQLDSAISIVLMDYIPQALLGLFLVHRACSGLSLSWGSIGMRVPTGAGSWVKMVGLSLLVLMMALPVVFLCQILSSLVWDTMDAMAPFILRIYEEGSLLEFGLVSVILAPIFEEILFRGFLFSSLRARMKARPANWIQAFAFAFLHFNPAGFVPLMALGVVIGKLRESTSSVVPGILIHAMYNTLVSLIMLFQLGG